jgi:hypothetical protein
MPSARACRKFAAPGEVRALAAMRGQLECVELEWQGHVAAAPTCREERACGLGERAHRRRDGGVLDAVVRELAEARMDARRKAVRDRVSEDGVAVHGDPTYIVCGRGWPNAP